MKSKSMIELYNTILPLLENLKKDSYDMSYMSIPRIRFSNGGSVTEYVESPDYANIIRYNCSDKIDNLDKIRLIDLLKEEFPYFINSPIGSRTQRQPNQIENLIKIIMINVLTRDYKLENLKILLQKEISCLEKLLNDKKVNVRVIAPIANLDIKDFNSRDILIEKNIKIVKLTEEDLEKRVHGLHRYYSLLPRFAVQIDYIDDLILHDDPKGFPPEPPIIQEIPNKIKKIVYAINLISSGAISVPMTWVECLGFAGNLMHGMGSGSPGHTPFGKMCNVEFKDIDLLINFYKKFGLKFFHRFELPLKRLFESELRQEAEDSVLDSIIGLENLLLNNVGNGKDRGEMTYRFSLNYTTLFDENKKEKRKFALDAYSLRSTIVHGDVPKDKIQLGNKKVNIQMAALEIRDMLRYTLISLLSLPEDNNFYTEGFWINRVIS